jgi:sodium/potassium/calcium exchanger 6
MLLAMAVTFGFLLTAAERFFCPALEYIADRLRLPPAVAGATLLSFGNGAPDVFTMLAAVKQARRGSGHG